MKISKKDYITMQVMVTAIHATSLPVSERLDRAIERFGIEVEHEESPEVSPALVEDFRNFYYYNDYTAEFSEISEWLKERGLLK